VLLSQRTLFQRWVWLFRVYHMKQRGKLARSESSLNNGPSSSMSSHLGMRWRDGEVHCHTCGPGNSCHHAPGAGRDPDAPGGLEDARLSRMS
jgi:hypothetical protein